MFLKNPRLFVAASLFATSLVALFGGCGLSTHGTATNTEARCTDASQCDDKEACTADECSADGVCTHSALPDGDGPPSTQTPGSCRKSVCKAGVLTVVNDDLNVSDDGEFCTDDECKDGKPTHPKKADTTECKVGQATGHCAAGKCAVECGVGLPACDDKNPCSDDSCDVANGKCVFSPLDGVKIPGVADQPGDCKTPRCIGGTAVETAYDDTDLPAATTDCETPTCTAGVPSLPPIAIGAGCSTSGGTVCDGDGKCVECNIESDCKNLPESNECQTRTCKAHKCGTDFVPDNTALVAQSPGDCQVVVCDGKGNKVSRNDDKDLPQDGNDCRDHQCVNGVPQTPPLAINTKCGQQGLFYCDGAGSCVGCTEAKQCNGVDDDCKTRTCVDKKCGFDYTATDTPLPDPKQTSGNCQQLQCDGKGNIKSVAFDTDLPVDNNDCTLDVCSSGIPANPPVQADTVCSKGYCDGNKSCVQCTKAAQCPAPPICVTATCDANVCGTSNVALGTLAPAGQQISGDCKDAICDGKGGTTTQPNVGDLPNDKNDCTADTCNAQGTPVYSNKPAHTACAQNNGKVCDGSGACLGCVDNGDCTAPSTCGGGNPGTPNVCGCTKKTCVQQNATCGNVADGCGVGGTIACNNGVKDGSETDVDCGGNGSTCGVKCGQGKACGANSDCSSGFCVDGVCCNAACTAGCKACSKALNGTADGQCLDAVIGKADPRGVCAAGDVCAANAKCQCADGAKNGAETSADCGGGVCPKCITGKTCSVGGDCGTGFCADGYCCDKACTGACVACSQALNGVSNGNCGNIPANASIDPNHGSCANAGDVCGAGGQCRCADGAKSTGETDVDCGGATCGKCTQGKTCAANSDCSSGFCVDGFCCDKACGGACEACSKAKTGLADGTCGGVAAGSQPKVACPNVGDVCGVGGKCRCTDGAKSTGETDVDCGGAVCGKCGQGKACGVAGDCTSTFCADGYCCDSACGACKACSAAMTGGANGTCANVTVSTDPHNVCMHGAGSESCSATGLCSCADSVQNGLETDVDCGGTLCDKCAQSKACNVGTDCQSGVCQGKKCTLSTCGNSVKDGTETDVDCGGGQCQKCADGKVCTVATDCVNNTCLGGLCYPASCGDAQKDNTETDVDCGGGTCPKCADTKACAVNGDCTSGLCQGNKCVPATCGNGVKDGTETDIDCGGASCQKCANAKACSVNGDCTSNTCLGGKCYAATCNNGALDAGESDTDCGGSCPACALGKVCSVDGDCGSVKCRDGYCCNSSCGACKACSGALTGGANGLCLDVTPYTDPHNQCGGADACGVGNKCQCADGVENGTGLGTESDIDCGGNLCSKCADGKKCAQNSDCNSNVCDPVSLLCFPASCGNAVKDNAETDVDCGGGTCPGCGTGKTCAVNGDCVNGNCLGTFKCN